MNWMKRALPLLFAAILVLGTGFAPGNEKAVVKIDGQAITPEGVLRFERDDTVMLEASGIKPNSEVTVKVKKAGIKWANHTFFVNKKGGVAGIMHMPEKKLKVSCTVEYYDADGTFNEVKFKFQTY